MTVSQPEVEVWSASRDVSREARLAGLLLGLCFGEDSASPPEAAGRHASQALLVLDSLASQGRFVKADVTRQLSDWAQSSGISWTCEDAFPRSLALAAWLRGSDERIARAAWRLAQGTRAGVRAAELSVVLSLWARRLYLRSRATDALAYAYATVESLKEEGVFEAVDQDEDPSQPEAADDQDLDAWWNSVCKVVCLADGFAPALQALAAAKNGPAAAAVVGALVGLREGPRGLPECRREVWEAHPGVAAALNVLVERTREFPSLAREPAHTSKTHPLPIVEIPETDGRIALAFCPGARWRGNEGVEIRRDLRTDLASIAARGAQVLVCLLRTDEIIDQDMTNYRQLAGELGMELIHLPPQLEEDDAWFRNERDEVIAHLLQAHAASKRIVLHDDMFSRLAVDVTARLLTALKLGGGSALVHCLAREAHNNVWERYQAWGQDE